MTFTEAEAPPPDEAQSRLEKRMAELAMLALVMAQNGEDDETDTRVLMRTARTVARLSVYAAIAYATRDRGVKGQVDDVLARSTTDKKAIDDWVEQKTKDIADTVRGLAHEAAQRMKPAPGESEKSGPEQNQERRDWVRSAADTLSTRTAGEAVLQLAGPLQTQLGQDLKKVWISRGDNRVRELHRKLHGKTADLDKPFWRELGTGKQLGFPGDPRAPLDQTINCRCHLFLVRADQAPKAEEVLHIPASDFALAAAARLKPEYPEIGIKQDFEVVYGA